MRLQLVVRVEVVGVEVTPAAGPGIGGQESGMIEEADPQSKIQNPKSPAPILSADAEFLRALAEDPALRQLLLDALDSAPPTAAVVVLRDPTAAPAPPTDPSPPTPAAEDHP